MGNIKGLARRTVLLPGDLLPEGRKCAGKHHGVILRVETQPGPGGYPHAVIQLTDFLLEGTKTKKLKVALPVEQVLPYVVPKAATGGRAKREAALKSREEEWERDAGINYDIPRWASLDRQHAPKKAKRAPDAPPLHGPQLQERLSQLQAAPHSERFPAGTRLWVRVAGSGLWPGVAWTFALCKRRDLGQLLLSHRPGMVLVRFYGEHSNMWVRQEDCELPLADETEHLRQLRAAGRQQNKMRLLELALSELEGAHKDPEHERRRMAQLYERYLHTRQAPDNCYLCRELGAELECVCCDRLFHPICLHYPAVSSAELPEGIWACPCCGEEQKVGEVREDVDAEGGSGEVERMGLTPDWIIEAAAFGVFGLERPTATCPYIAGLLDPCTNSKLAPNIPAEKLYDKQDNGLKLSNSWEGFHVLLNPDYRAQVQWRFVNRAIDEVENGQVPCVVLVCRNSTDTGYFQRLRPYPRVLLRRMSARFKDYDKTPIGFGIAVFCIAKTNVREVYCRFHEAFEPMGEPNIPVDTRMVQSAEFYGLLERLRVYAAQHHRDHWVQCTACGKWRIVDFQAAQQIDGDTDWSCAMLRPPFSSCQTPLSRNEQVGGHYAVGGADWAGSGDEEEAGGMLRAHEHNIRCGSASGDPGVEAVGTMRNAAAKARQEEIGVMGIAVKQQLLQRGTAALREGTPRVPGAGLPAAATRTSSGRDTAVATPVAAAGQQRQAPIFEPGICSGMSSPSSPVEVAADSVGKPLVKGHLPAAFQPKDRLQHEVPQQGHLQEQLPAPLHAPQQPQEQQTGLAVAAASVEASHCAHQLVQQPAGNALAPDLCGAQPGASAGWPLPAPPPSVTRLIPAAPGTMACLAQPQAAGEAGSFRQQQQQQQLQLQPVQQAPQHIPAHPLPSASQVVCSATLQELVRLPPRNISLDAVEGAGGQPVQVLSALELARQARIAANRAYLAGLGLGPQAMNKGQVTALAPNDPVMLAAARALASRAAAEQSRRQLEEVRRRYDAARRQRQREEPHLLGMLRNLQEEEQGAWQQLEQAERAAEHLRHKQQDGEGTRAGAHDTLQPPAVVRDRL